MASFKEMMKNFLYETVDDEEEEVLEPEKKAEPAAKPSVTVVPVTPAAPVTPAPQPVQSDMQPVYGTPEDSLPASELAVPEMETGTVDEMSFLEEVSRLSEPEPKKKNTVKKNDPKKPYRYDRSKMDKGSGKTRTPLTSSDYQAVMSPIFGNAEDNKKSREAIHDAINLPKPDASFDMVQVISPMFGNRRKKAESHAKEERPVRSIPSYQSAQARHKSAAPGKDLSAAPVQETSAPAPEEKPAEKPEAKPAAKEERAARPVRKSNDLASFLTREPAKKPAAEEGEDK